MAIVSLLKLIFWTFVLFLALSYFGISIQTIVNSPVGHANVQYLSDLTSQLWSVLGPLYDWATEWVRPYLSNTTPAPLFGQPN